MFFFFSDSMQIKYINNISGCTFLNGGGFVAALIFSFSL